MFRQGLEVSGGSTDTSSQCRTIVWGEEEVRELYFSQTLDMIEFY